MTPILFYSLGFIALFAALMTVLSKNPIHSVLYLILTFFAIAGHYVLLNAQFLAVVNVIVYAGAIMVLFLFVIMLLNLNKETEPQKSSMVKLIGTIGAGVLLVLTVAVLKKANASMPMGLNEGNINIGLVKNLGKVLFNDFLLPFEFASILLLSAMVGAVLLASKDAKTTN